MQVTKVLNIRKIEIYEVTDHLDPKDGPNPDMLRYDHCYTGIHHPNKVAYLNGEKPTVERWASFLQTLTFVEQTTFIAPDTWFTMVRSGSGTGELIKEFLINRKEITTPVIVHFKTKDGGNGYK